MNDESGEGAESGSRAEKKAQSRRRILDSAREVFFRDGFMAANLDEVADRAGVAKGTLYRYFESKADLYVAVLAEGGEVFTQKMSEVVSPGLGSLENLEAVARFYLEHWTRHPDYFQIFWAMDNQSVIGDLPEAAVAEVAKLWEASLSILDTVLAAGVREGRFAACDTWEVANILWTTANGLIQSEYNGTRRNLRRQPLEEVYQKAIALILAGMSRPDPAESQASHTSQGSA